MATRKHLNRECEGGSLFEDQCSPHVFLIDLFRMSTEHQQYSPENQLEVIRQYATAT